MTDKHTAVIDRIVDDRTAVLLIEGDESVDTQFDIPIEDIPRAGRYEGAVFTAAVEDDQIQLIELREGEAEDRKTELKRRFDQLSERIEE